MIDPLHFYCKPINEPAAGILFIFYDFLWLAAVASQQTGTDRHSSKVQELTTDSGLVFLRRRTTKWL